MKKKETKEIKLTLENRKFYLNSSSREYVSNKQVEIYFQGRKLSLANYIYAVSRLESLISSIN